MSRYQFSNIDPETTIVITGSQRLARHIRESYNQQQANLDKKVWSSLQVMPWGAWVNHCWLLLKEHSGVESDARNLPLLLTEKQESYLWQDIVENSSFNNYLLQTKSTTKKAQQAWQQLQQWQLDIAEQQSWDLDAQAFKEWQNTFQKKLKANDWIDLSSSINLINKTLVTIKHLLPKQIYLAGFEQITPQQQQCFEQLELFSSVAHLIRTKLDTKVKSFAFDSSRQELRTAIRKASASLQQHYPNNQNYKFAIVVPDLEQNKALIENILWQELTPNRFLHGIEFENELSSPKQKEISMEHGGVFDISLGEPLAKHALVETALILLKLLGDRVERRHLQQLLLSPYWGEHKSQLVERAVVEKNLRKNPRQYWNLNQVLGLLIEKEGLKSLVDSLSKWREKVQVSNSLDNWLSIINEILQQLSWPGYRTINSREYQLKQAFIESFKQLRQYQLLYKKNVTFKRFVGLLTNLIEDQEFHQELPKAPIQVMGLLETVGLEFDEIWLTGATNMTLPQQPNPNPFITKQLLKKYQMPGSSSAREWSYAKQLMDNLLVATSKLNISYAIQDGDTELLASPLIYEYGFEPLSVNTSESLAPDFIKQLSKESQLELYLDSHGIGFSSEQHIKGGTGFFKTQVNCPFQAYAKYRLNAFPFDQEQEGLSALERGNIVHRVLELFWNQYRSSSVLQNIESHECSVLLEPIVDNVINEYKSELFFLNVDAFAKIEKTRLIEQVTEALLEDKKRPEFLNIVNEYKQSIEINGLSFTMKVDRIDQVNNGQLIIDYKTGDVKKTSLTCEPPREPQLPLYAILQAEQGESLAGVAFFNINAKGAKYEGVADDVSDLNARLKSKHSIDEYIVNWKTQLEKVAEQIKQGYAEVIPDSCTYCDYQAICRINQRDLIDVQGDLEHEN